MKKTIFIFCYSYQKKNLDSLFNMVKSFSNDYIVSFTLVDQSSINKEDKLPSTSNSFLLNYIHVAWDSISSPIEYKKYFLITSKFDYYMQIGDQTDIGANVLNKAIEFLDTTDSCIITYDDIISGDFEAVPRINRNLIIATRLSSSKIKFPSFAKYNGEQEYIYYKAIENGLTVYGVSSKMVNDKTVDLNSLDYVPFYLNHNYNKIAEELGLIKNKHEYNDVSYDIRKSKFDAVLGERYINKTKIID